MDKNIKYVQQNRIAPLLNDMVMHLLATTPDEPLDGLILYLEKRFPAEAEAASEKTGIPKLVRGEGQEERDGGKGDAGGKDPNFIPSPPKEPPQSGEGSEGRGRTPVGVGKREKQQQRPDVPPLATTNVLELNSAGSHHQAGSPLTGDRGSMGILTPRERTQSLGGAVSSSMMSQISASSGNFFGGVAPMFGQDIASVIEQLRQNEELIMAAVGSNRVSLSPDAADFTQDRTAALKAEGFSDDFLSVLGSIESNHRSGQVAINSAFFGQQEPTPLVLLQRIAENEAGFLQLLQKASKATRLKKERSQLDEAVDNSQEFQSLLLEMGENAEKAHGAVYDTLYCQALGKVSDETDPQKILELLQQNEEAFQDQVTGARRNAKTVVDRALLTQAETRSAQLLAALAEMGDNCTQMSHCVGGANAIGGETTAEANRVLSEMLANEEQFLSQLSEAVKSESNPDIKKALKSAAFSSEDTVQLLQQIDATGSDVELSFAAFYGTLSTEEITTLKALRLIQDVSNETRQVAGELQEAQIEGGDALSKENQEVLQQMLDGQREVQALLAVAQERELLIEGALHCGGRGLYETSAENHSQLRSTVEEINENTPSNLNVNTSGSPIYALVDSIVCSTDLVSSTLEHALSVEQRAQLVHLQIAARKTALAAQLLPAEQAGPQSSPKMSFRDNKRIEAKPIVMSQAVAQKLFSECRHLAQEVARFYNTLQPELKAELVALKAQTALVDSVEKMCDGAAVAHGILA